MSKKKFLISFFIVLGIIIVALAATYFALMHNKTFTVARIIKTETNSYLWITENSGPTEITQKGLCDFEGIDTGDKVLLVCENMILETYPGQNTVYFCKKLEDGTRNDLPQGVLKSLEKMGWKISYTDSTDTIESIVDKTKNSDIATAQALEKFYENAIYDYYFSSIKSEYIIVTFKDGTKTTVTDALEKGQISLSDLDYFNIDYIKEPKVKEREEYFFDGKILEVNENAILVKPNEDEIALKSEKEISVALDFESNIPLPTFNVGDDVRVIYNGLITKSIPPQINGVFAVYLLDDNENILSPTPKND